MVTRFFLSNKEPHQQSTSKGKPLSGSSGNGDSKREAPSATSKSTITTSTSAVNASPRFVKASTTPILDSDDAESVTSSLPDKRGAPRSPGSILSHDDSHLVSSDDMSFLSPNPDQTMMSMMMQDSTLDDLFLEIEQDQEGGTASPQVAFAGSGPQLIMPMVSLPSRRPFTPNGMKLGKLKILLAGDSGVGKSGLIQAIAQINEDIVHVDEPVPGDHDYEHGQSIWQVNASTKPFPLFWLNDHKPKDGETSQTHIQNQDQSQRRPSLVHSASSARSDESALERNICFVDTAGYGDESVDAVINYLDKQFRRTAEIINSHSPQVLSLLTSTLSSDFSHVDVCFYLVTNKLKQADLNYMRQLNSYCPIIPLVAKSDLVPPDQVLDLKVDILKQMHSAGIDPFLFDTQVENAIECGEMLQDRPKESAPNGYYTTSGGDETTLHPLLFPTTVSSIESSTEMVASVLMSPNYVPELADSELKKLCSYVFSEQGSAWLRYIAAKRFIDWSVSFHVSNCLESQLSTAQNTVPSIHPNAATLIKMDRSSATTSSSSTPVRFSDGEEYVINLPSSVFPTSGTRAQQQTAKWVMQLEQAARSDNAYALRASTRRSQPGSGRKGNPKNRPQLPESILNLDPFGLRGLSQKALQYVLKALSLILGIKIVAIIYSKAMSGPELAHVSPKLQEPAGGAAPPHEPPLLALINSIGWPILRL